MTSQYHSKTSGPLKQQHQQHHHHQVSRTQEGHHCLLQQPQTQAKDIRRSRFLQHGQKTHIHVQEIGDKVDIEADLYFSESPDCSIGDTREHKAAIYCSSDQPATEAIN